jgi:antirestriction protein ArdC
VIFWKQLGITETGTDGSTKNKVIPLLKHYNVFNAEEIDGLSAKFFPQSLELADHQPIPTAAAIIESMPARPDIAHAGGKACYSPTFDRVTMPESGRFERGEEYYSTLFHELAHATGHESRLARKLGGVFGSPEYAREELIAEMTSAFLCAESGISPAVIENQAAYLDGWRRALKADSKCVIVAAGAAQRAADFILDRRAADAAPAAESPALIAA